MIAKRIKQLFFLLILFVSVSYVYSSPNETKLSNIIFYNTECNVTEFGLQNQDDEATKSLKKEYKKVVHYMYKDSEWFICNENKYGNKGWKEEVIYHNFDQKECIIFFSDSIQHDLNRAAVQNKRKTVDRNMGYDDSHFKYEKDMEDGTHIVVFDKYDEDTDDSVFFFFW